MASLDPLRYLNSFQKEVYQECLQKKSGGLSLTMGSGKTLLSIVLALTQSSSEKKILVVCSKSLIPVWLLEIKKFFGEELSHQILHSSYLKKASKWVPETKLVITTPGLLGNTARDHVFNQVIHSHGSPPTQYYYPARKPLLEEETGLKSLFSTHWGTLIVDEIHEHNNVKTNACRGLIGICADHKWLLSGTMFKEPPPERILGYYCILDQPKTPRSIPDTRAYISPLPQKRKGVILRFPFPGLAASMVIRDSNPTFTPPRVNQRIVFHQMDREEAQIYLKLKNVFASVAEKAIALKETDPIRAAVYRAHCLTLLIYLRQVLISPFIPLTSAAIKSLEMISKDKRELAATILREIFRVTSRKWMNDPKNVRSSRIRRIVSETRKYSQEPIVIFTSFRTTLDLIKSFLPKNRPTFTLEQGDSFQKRGKVIEDFGKTSNGILLLTYNLGSSGYNLQVARTVFLVDFWWNAGTTQQAIARVLRYGQKADQVNILYFTSNTMLEKMIYEKHHDKLEMIRCLYQGPTKKKVNSMKIEELLNFTQMKETTQYLRKIYF